MTHLDEDILATIGVVSPDAVADDVDVVEEPLVEVRPLSDRRQVLDQHLNLGHLQCGYCSLPSFECQRRYHIQSQCGGSKLELFCEGAELDNVSTGRARCACERFWRQTRMDKVERSKMSVGCALPIAPNWPDADA